MRQRIHAVVEQRLDGAGDVARWVLRAGMCSGRGEPVDQRAFGVSNAGLDDPDRVVSVDEGSAEGARTVRAPSSRPPMVNGPLRCRR